MNNVISIKNLSFSYLDNVIFDKFNLDIKENSFVSVIGNNGSGKSTLFKIIEGILDYQGDIYINDNLVTKENIIVIRKYMGYVNGDIDNYFVSDSVMLDLVFSLENLGLSKDDISKKLDTIINIFQLDNLINKKINELSKKEKIIVAISCSLIYNPKILLIDELFSNIDNTMKKEIFTLINKYRKYYSLSILMVTHDMEDTLYSDKIILLDKGKIIRYDDIVKFFMDEYIIKCYNIKIPFVIELSILLKKSGIIDKVYTDMYELMEVL